jgi:CMP-N-acetylneuraminic acid synthetase
LNILGLIPARGGSKGIPNKNLVPLVGRPLIEYTFEAALASQGLTRVVLNTDDPTIAQIGRDYGIEVPFMRPAGLARDDTLMVEVLQHALITLQDIEDYWPEIVVLLQPTSPLRRAEHIDAAVNLLLEKNADTVVSVVEVPHQFSPSSVMRLEGERLAPYLEGPLILRRQDKPRFYARNGPAVLVTRRTVLESDRLYGDVVWPLIMNVADSVDIDDTTDLALAEFWLKRQKVDDE